MMGTHVSIPTSVLMSAVSERDAAELLIQAIEYMALDGGFLDSRLTTLRRDLDL